MAVSDFGSLNRGADAKVIFYNPVHECRLQAVLLECDELKHCISLWRLL